MKREVTWAFAVVSIIFTFVPESFFSVIRWKNIPQFIVGLSNNTFDEGDINIVFNRLLLYVAIWIIVTILYSIYFCCRKSVTIKADNYIIEIKYGDIFKEKNCKRVIPFDECFTTIVGTAPHEIKSTSICGQYLRDNPNLNVQRLVANVYLMKERRKSKFRNLDRYKSGTIVPNGNDLLLAFVPLDNYGIGVFSSYKDYLDSLFLLWKELDKYYAQQDICIPILGSGITRIGDGMGAVLSQQELLEMIIESYKLSPYKLKKPYKLRIVCRKGDNFSLGIYG